MTNAELLTKIKAGLGITGTYQDETLMTYIDEVKNYLIDAGVAVETVNSSASVGVITRGVSDLWNYGMSNTSLSDYFVQRAIQLKYVETEEEKILGNIVVISVPGSKFGTTKLTVTGQSDNALFKYKMNPQAIDLPEYDDDLSDWITWDGISDIFAEDGHFVCVAEVTLENLARKAGTTRIVINLG